MKTFRVFLTESAVDTPADQGPPLIEPGGYNGPVTIAHERPVTFAYVRRKSGATHHGARFGQDIEPAGRYMNIRAKAFTPTSDLHETGVVTFTRPFVLNADAEDAYGPDGWKARLSRFYGGKTGRRLSQAIRNDGYDGIITISRKYRGSGEVVDLTHLTPTTVSH